MPTDVSRAAADLWATVGGDPAMLEQIAVTGPDRVLPSTLAVTTAAAAAVATATLAVAEVAGRTDPIAVDTRHVGAAVRSERHLERLGADRPASLWDPVAGDYPTADGWIRLHTNYRHHRRAALSVLQAPEDRDAVASAVRSWPATALETAVVAAGGCAAEMRTAEAWHRHEHGRRVCDRPLVSVTPVGDASAQRHEPADGSRPLSGLRVLDLTRVIAGPVASRFLAAWGADVLRVESPHFSDLETVVIDVGFGKRSCALDLRAGADRHTFEALVAGTDVLIHGYRPGALAALGYSPEALAARRPGIVVGWLSAYGTEGAWGGRRGFDSLVQMSTGIAAEGAEAAGSTRPTPLPCQLLDHGTGYLLALGVLRALARRGGEAGSWTVETSLARTAAWIDGLARDPDGLSVPEPSEREVDRWRRSSPTPWGEVRHVAAPGAIGTMRPAWDRPPSRPGTDEPAWLDAR